MTRITVVSLFFILVLLNFGAKSQCQTYTSAVSDLTLQCSGGTANRSGVAFYPTQNVYFSVNQGSAVNPVETFSINGAALNSTLQGVNFNGLWYNPNIGRVEGNVFSTGAIVQQSVNPVNGFATGNTSLALNASQPAQDVCGQYDPDNDHVLYYSNLAIHKYSRNTGNLVSTLNIGLLPAATINTTCLIYTGVMGSEVGLYDYINKRIYFINYSTGLYVGTCQLPVNAPSPSSQGVAFTNNRLFLFDASQSRWYGYKVSNKSDISFYGHNVLCKNQEKWLMVNEQGGSINGFTWTPHPSVLGGSSSGVAIVQLTTTTVFSVATTNTAGCSNGSSFVMTVYPNAIYYFAPITGIDSLHCTNLSAVTLSTSGQVTYTWITGAQSNTVSVSPTITTVYRHVSTDTLGCINFSQNFTLTVFGNPTVNISSTHTLVCNHETVTLTASGASTYTWMNNSTANSTTVAPVTSGFYSVIGENNIGCKHLQNIHIKVGKVPSLNPENELICKGRFASIMVNSNNGPASYTWSTGELNYIIIVQPTITTSYTVYASNVEGCTNSAVATVTVSECVGIEDFENIQLQPLIYPNPNQGEFTVQSAIGEFTKMEILNSNGVCIHKEEIKDSEYRVELETTLPRGFYLLVFTKENSQTVIKKMIKN